MNFHPSNHIFFFCHFSIFSLCFWRNSIFEYITRGLSDSWSWSESWPTTPVNISIEPRGPEVDSQLTLCPSQIVQLCDGHGWSALFTLPLPPAFCSWSTWSQCWPWAHIHWDRRCSHGLITFLEQNSQILSKSANLLPGHTLPWVADKSAFYCFMLSFHPCSPGFWLHVFTNLLTVHLLKVKHSALVVAGH